MLNPTFIPANKANKCIFFNPMGLTNKGILAEPKSSKLSSNIKISNNSSKHLQHVNVNRDRKLLWRHRRCKDPYENPKHIYDPLGLQHLNVNRDNKLLWRHLATGEDPDELTNNELSFSMLCTDNNGRLYSPEKKYCLAKHRHSLENRWVSNITGSCNGILLFKDTDCGFLWNPVTDELKSLPHSSIEFPENDIDTGETSGIGFDARSEDYKIVRVIKKDYFPDYARSELYSLKNDSWRLIVSPVDIPYCSDTISLNGSCYWHARNCVLSFDFADEVFSYLPYPVIRSCEHRRYFFFDIDGLTLGSIVEGDEKRYDLWVWKSNEWCWCKVDSFVLENVSWPLGFWGRDKCFFWGTNNEMMLFDLTTRELTPLGIIIRPRNPYIRTKSFSLVSFVESTVSIKGHSKPGEMRFGEKESVSQDDVFSTVSNIRKTLVGKWSPEKLVHVVEKLQCRAHGQNGITIRVLGSFIVGSHFLICGEGVEVEGLPNFSNLSIDEPRNRMGRFPEQLILEPSNIIGQYFISEQELYIVR